MNKCKLGGIDSDYLDGNPTSYITLITNSYALSQVNFSLATRLLLLHPYNHTLTLSCTHDRPHHHSLLNSYSHTPSLTL